MTKKELLDAISDIEDDYINDPAKAENKVIKALLAYINDKEITEAYWTIEKWDLND